MVVVRLFFDGKAASKFNSWIPCVENEARGGSSTVVPASSPAHLSKLQAAWMIRAFLHSFV